MVINMEKKLESKREQYCQELSLHAQLTHNERYQEM